jgi:hypothetical protein
MRIEDTSFILVGKLLHISCSLTLLLCRYPSAAQNLFKNLASTEIPPRQKAGVSRTYFRLSNDGVWRTRSTYGSSEVMYRTNSSMRLRYDRYPY